MQHVNVFRWFFVLQLFLGDLKTMLQQKNVFKQHPMSLVAKNLIEVERKHDYIVLKIAIPLLARPLANSALLSSDGNSCLVTRLSPERVTWLLAVDRSFPYLWPAPVGQCGWWWWRVMMQARYDTKSLTCSPRVSLLWQSPHLSTPFSFQSLCTVWCFTLSVFDSKPLQKSQMTIGTALHRVGFKRLRD